MAHFVRGMMSGKHGMNCRYRAVNPLCLASEPPRSKASGPKRKKKNSMITTLPTHRHRRLEYSHPLASGERSVASRAEEAKQLSLKTTQKKRRVAMP